MKYDIDYFIKKFSKIPPKHWTDGEYVKLQTPKVRCALGHCNENHAIRTEESNALRSIFNASIQIPVGVINDTGGGLFEEKTPKARIMAALNYIKRKY